MSTYDRILAQIKRNRQFDEHVIKKVGPTTWFCHRPGHGSMGSFFVSTQHGAILMWGDMGETIYMIYGGSSIVWGKRNFHPDNTYYPLTKLSPAHRIEQFSTEAATDYLKERVEEAKTSTVLDEKALDRAEEMLSEWKDRCGNEYYEDEGEWWRLWSEFDDPDAPNMREFVPRVWWTFFCLCWFFSHVSADDERFKEAYGAWSKSGRP
jgi:hypothetical protein